MYTKTFSTMYCISQLNKNIIPDSYSYSCSSFRSSVPSQFLTHGEKPSGPPRNVRITGLSSTSLEVTWDDPEKRLMHGPITRYSLGYREYK